MTDTHEEVLHEEQLHGRYQYVEKRIEPNLSFPTRRCSLTTQGEEEPICKLDLLSFELRFGATAIEVEGLGGVQTMPEHRRRGHMAALMDHALGRATERVGAAFLFGIGGFYHRWGFVPVVPDTSMTLETADVERTNGAAPRLVEGSTDDLADAIALYNDVHGQRPCTVKRGSSWNRLAPDETWQPGPEWYVWRHRGELLAYVVLRGHYAGWGPREIVARELCAREPEHASGVLRVLSRWAVAAHRQKLEVAEPVDSAAGVAARRFGCTVEHKYYATGFCMGVTLDRARWLGVLQPELERRGQAHRLEQTKSRAACAALLAGELVPDNGTLLQLMVGYVGYRDAGVSSGGHEEALRAWFAGTATETLPAPHSHRLDRY